MPMRACCSWCSSVCTLGSAHGPSSAIAPRPAQWRSDLCGVRAGWMFFVLRNFQPPRHFLSTDGHLSPPVPAGIKIPINGRATVAPSQPPHDGTRHHVLACATHNAPAWCDELAARFVARRLVALAGGDWVLGACHLTGWRWSWGRAWPSSANGHPVPLGAC